MTTTTVTTWATIDRRAGTRLGRHLAGLYGPNPDYATGATEIGRHRWVQEPMVQEPVDLLHQEPPDPLDALPWGADPADLVATADGDDVAIRLARFLRSVQPDWMTDAECRRPEHQAVQFFPERGQPARPALAVCAACPVVERCRTWALADASMVGICGGTTARQRAGLRARATTSSGLS